jgi:6-phosphogluconate dehydrogenase
MSSYARYSGFVQDFGEGRWTIMAAIEEAVAGRGALGGAIRPLPLARGAQLCREGALGALRNKFGGHVEPKEGG